MNIEVTINTRGIDMATVNLTRLDQIVRAMALTTQANAQASMTGPKSGRLYRKGRRRRGAGVARRRTKPRMHRASAPGEAPARDTGNLANAIGIRQIGNMTWEVYVRQPASKYGAALEFGSPRRRLAPRPFMRPALERVRKPFIAAIERELFGGLF
jgi:hypothetical protein